MSRMQSILGNLLFARDRRRAKRVEFYDLWSIESTPRLSTVKSNSCWKCSCVHLIGQIKPRPRTNCQ